MLELLPTDSHAIIHLLIRTFTSPQAVANFVVKSALSKHILPKLRLDTLENAVTSLFSETMSTGEFPVVFSTLQADYEHRQDISQAILTLSERPGWPEHVNAALASATVDVWTSKESKKDVSNLQRLTNDYDPFVDAKIMARTMTDAIQRVCFLRRIIGKQQLGTGFLIGPDQVLTCYHVVDKHSIESGPDHILVEGLEVVFDFARDTTEEKPDQTSLLGIGIDATVVAPFSPAPDADSDPDNDKTAAIEPKLDFVVLTLQASPPGNRDFFKLIDRDPQLFSPVVIAQHPLDPSAPSVRLQPLQVTFAQPGINWMNRSRTRVSYYNGTLQGSSGSPVFDRSGDVVALHHSRGRLVDPKSEQVKDNRGIPIRAIIAALRRIRDRRTDVKKSSNDNSQGSGVKVQPQESAPIDDRLEKALSSMTQSEIADFVLRKVGEDPDLIETWAQTPLDSNVLIHWAIKHGRLPDLYQSLGLNKAD